MADAVKDVRCPPGSFRVPDAAKDQHGNPVVRRAGKMADPASGYAYEVWLENPRIEFVLVPAGQFAMGSTLSPEEAAQKYAGRGGNARKAAAYARREHPRHSVRIAKAFYLGKYQVTNAQYRRFAPSHDSQSFRGVSLNGEQQPVVRVSWLDAMAFCDWLKGQTGSPARLPTEAEWEYACRAGTQTPFYWGDALDPQYCNFADRRTSFRWSDPSLDDGYAASAPVGRFKPNAWGLYDMLGNAWEWCNSQIRAYPYRADDGREERDSPKPRVIRGGGWDGSAFVLRCAHRFWNTPDFSGMNRGFRLALTVA